jgi:sugar-specific transcriptional regulator TrmB
LDIIDSLVRFGLTRQEAVVYERLCAGGPQNGYEVAKTTGISRSNAYSSLAGLVEKGAADTQDGTPVRYAAVPPSEFCDQNIRNLQENRAMLVSSLKVVQSPPETAYVTIRGRQRISACLAAMLDSVGERVYLSVPEAMLEPLVPKLAALVALGRKVVVLASCLPDLPGAILYRQDDGEGRIRLIVDSRLVLTGSLSGATPTCLYSGDIHLVELIKDALRNEIRLTGANAGQPEPKGVHHGQDPVCLP